MLRKLVLAPISEVEHRSNHRSQGKRHMLVLTRRRNESIIINDNIKIVVIGIRGDRVRLGIEAPPEIPVHRREVFEQIRKSQQALSPGGATPAVPGPEAKAPPADPAEQADSPPKPDRTEEHPAPVASQS
jgi:carbon storage regulator